MLKSIIDRALHLSSSPVLLHFTLPILMLYLIIGTIAQKYIGLYDATQTFFAAWILWLGPLPLPGMPPVLALIAINLCGKLIFKSPWFLSNAGIIITHIGALLLLAGGLLTAAFSTEGYIDIPVGGKSNTISDYHARTFVIEDETGNTIAQFNHTALIPKQEIQTPFKLTILGSCRNCRIQHRVDTTRKYHGMAQFMSLTPDKPKNTNEENMGGVTFRVEGISPEQDGIYLVLEDVPKLPEFKINEKTYRISLRKSRRTLPFTLELLDFKREVYPGTDKPKSYESIVRIHDGGAQWQTTISMNAPLRYKGYTFFQSSFIATADGNISVLAAVWNVGRTFPYIASITMGLGILIHILMRRRKS